MRKTEKSDFGENSKFCGRGLEHQLSAAILDQRNMNKDIAIGAVLAEQKDLQARGETDPEVLRVASSTCSARARETALAYGRLDAKAAACIHGIKDTTSEVTTKDTGDGGSSLYSILDNALRVQEFTTTADKKCPTSSNLVFAKHESQQMTELELDWPAPKQRVNLGSLSVLLNSFAPTPMSSEVLPSKVHKSPTEHNSALSRNQVLALSAL